MRDLLLSEAEYACLKEMAEAFERGDVYCNHDYFGLTPHNRFATLRPFSSNILIGDATHTGSGFYESFTIRSNTMQVLRSIEASERKAQEAIRLQQEQREHDRKWEAEQEEKARVWQAEQERIRHQREDRRDRVTWTIAAIGILAGLVGVYLASVLSKSDPPVVNVFIPEPIAEKK